MGDVVSDPFQAARLILRLRRAGVTDNGVLAVMEQFPRDKFIEGEYEDLAFEDAVLPIPCGQTILRPSVTAQLLQLAELTDPDARVLLIGLGGGYTAALISQLASDVFAIERYDRLFARGTYNLEQFGISNVYGRHGDGLLGWPEKGPFDRIILTGITERAPVALMQQLSKGGRLIQPISEENDQKIIVIDEANNQLKSIEINGFQHLSIGMAQEL